MVAICRASAHAGYLLDHGQTGSHATGRACERRQKSATEKAGGDYSNPWALESIALPSCQWIMVFGGKKSGDQIVD
jgi:hypothetical protein